MFSIKSFFKIPAFTEGSLAVGLARVGSEDQRILVCSLSEMKNSDLGPPLHCLVIPGETLHPLESEYLVQFASKCDNFTDMTKSEGH